MNKESADSAQASELLSGELMSIGAARGVAREELVTDFVLKHIAPELAKHYAFLVEKGMLKQSDLHPAVFACLRAIYGGACIDLDAGQVVGKHTDDMACVMHAPVGRVPTKAGRNLLIFDAVKEEIRGGSSLATAARVVSESVRHGDVAGVELQVLAARTVINIYRKLLNAP